MGVQATRNRPNIDGISLLKKVLKLICSISNRRTNRVHTLRVQNGITSRLDTAKLKLSGTELTGSSSLLLQHLLLVGVGVTNLDDVLFTTRLGNGSVIELLDDFLTNITGFKAIQVSSVQISQR